MMHSWKKYLKKKVACLLCAAMMLGYVPAYGAKAEDVSAEDVSDTPGWVNVKLQIAGEVVKSDAGANAKVKLSVKNTDAFKDVPADLQEHIVYYWYSASNVEDLPSQSYSKGESYELKGTDRYIQVKAAYAGSISGPTSSPTGGLEEINGVYPSGESRILEVKNGSLEVDAIADVTVKGSGKGAQNGAIEVDTSNYDLQYFDPEQPEDVKNFDLWKLEGLSENQKIGVKYKKNVLANTTVLQELYAIYTIPVDETQSPVVTPTVEPTKSPEMTAEPTDMPGNTTEPTKVPGTTTGPTKAPSNTTEPTKVPSNTTEPTKAPGTTTEPTKTPSNTTEPTKVPSNTTEPTKVPSNTAQPAPVDMSKPGTVATVGNVVYKSNGSNTVSYDGMKTDKKTVTVPDKVTVNGKSYSVTKISSGAFSGSKVQSVKLGSNVKTIGKKAFKNCKSLKKVTFSNKITTVNAESFSGCTKLGSVSLPASVKTVGAKAFKNCKKLKKFTLGKKTVKTKKGNIMFGATGANKVAIGASALENCLNLRSVIINSMVTKIGNNTFKNCKKLASMLVKSLKLKTVGNRALKGVNNCKISVPTIRLKKYRTLFTNKGQGKKVVIAKV